MQKLLDVSFSHCLDDGRSCVLVELNEEIEELVNECTQDTLPRLHLKGEEEENAILCTKSKTFKFKKVSTSNILLFCRTLENKLEATANLDCYIELVRTQPDSASLRRSLLNVGTFCGQDNPKGVLHNQITESFMGSEDELEITLKKISAINISNSWYIVDSNYADKLLKYLIAYIEAEGRSLNRVPCSLIHRILEEYGAIEQIRKWIVDHFFEHLENEIVTISNSKVARFIGEYILQSAPNNTLTLNEFMDRWRKAVHSSLDIELDLLKDLSFVHEEVLTINRRSLKVKQIRYCPKHTLPLDARERFEVLFCLCKRWIAKNFIKFVDDLAPDKNSLEKLLLKYTRSYHVDDELYYSKRFTLAYLNDMDEFKNSRLSKVS